MTTLPWYNNSNYLPAFKDSITTYWNQSDARGAKSFTIPVKFIVLLADGETANNIMPQSKFEILMNALNQAFQSNNMPLRFVMVCPTFVHKVDIDVNEAQWYLHLSGHRQAGAINVVIVGNGSAANFYSAFGDGIQLTRNRATEDFCRTFPHEVGHFFGLQHTHIYSQSTFGFCMREMVKRKTVYLPFLCNVFQINARWCNVTGDGFCDTPADPGVGTGAPLTDAAGDSFSPSLVNYMCYHTNSGRTTFTPDQCSAILYRFARRIAFGTISTNNIEMDSYEYDNADRSAKFITLGQTQQRTLIDASNCMSDDMDIIKHRVSKYVSPTVYGKTGSFYFDIANLTAGKEFISTINVFRTNSVGDRSTAITQAIISSDQKHIEVPCTAVSDNEIILIEITRINNREGKYQISLTESSQPYVTTNGYACLGTTFSVANLSGTATIDWSPTGFNLSNASGLTTKVTSINANNGILYTFINDKGCTVSIRNDIKLGAVPDPIIKGISSYGVYNNCNGFKYNFKANITGATSVDWQTACGPSSSCSTTKISDTEVEVSGGFISWDGNKGTYIEVTVVATNPCGVSVSYTYKTSFSRGNCLGTGGEGGKDNIQVVPNPSQTSTTIKMIPIEQEDSNNNNVVRVIRILNPVNGVQYETQTSASEIEIDVSNFMDGVYYVLVSRDGGTSQAVLVVQKE